jgi:hypothetical protein
VNDHPVVVAGEVDPPVAAVVVIVAIKPD